MFRCRSDELSVDLLIAACVVDLALAPALPAPGVALRYCAFRGLEAAEGHFWLASRTMHVAPHARVLDVIARIYIPDTCELARATPIDRGFLDSSCRTQRHSCTPDFVQPVQAVP